MWTVTELKSEAYPHQQEIWRAVEDQHVSSTLKLVDSIAEHEVLESLLEQHKPQYPVGTEQLHYLLKTPFRYYPAKPHGSRFRRAHDPQGVFYGSVGIRTVLAEFAYYRLRFFAAALDAKLPTQDQRLTVFSVEYQVQHEIDLTAEPFNKNEEQWAHPTSYDATQALATVARLAGIEAIRYLSVRDKMCGKNIALLHPFHFKTQDVKVKQSWYMLMKPQEVYIARSGSSKQVYNFHADEFQLEEPTSQELAV